MIVLLDPYQVDGKRHSSLYSDLPGAEGTEELTAFAQLHDLPGLSDEGTASEHVALRGFKVNVAIAQGALRRSPSRIRRLIDWKQQYADNHS